MRDNPVVIVPCGKAKREYSCRADEMYIGLYHRTCMAYARTLARMDSIFILSAKYGLLGCADVIEPYDLRMGDPGATSATQVFFQTLGYNRDIWRCSALVLGGEKYRKVCLAVWPQAETPLVGVGGIGKQIQWMQREIKSNATQ